METELKATIDTITDAQTTYLEKVMRHYFGSSVINNMPKWRYLKKFNQLASDLIEFIPKDKKDPHTYIDTEVMGWGLMENPDDEYGDIVVRYY